MSRHHSSWGKAARYSSARDGNSSPLDNDAAMSNEASNDANSNSNQQKMDYDDELIEDDTLEIRPMSLQRGKRDDSRASQGHRRGGQSSSSSGGNKTSSGDLRSSIKHRDRSDSSSRHQKRPRHAREEGEEVSSSADSPSVAPSAVADAVQSEQGGGVDREREMRERLEKMEMMRLKQLKLQEELKKYGVASDVKPVSSKPKSQKAENPTNAKSDEKSVEKAKEKDEKLVLPNRGMSAFVEEAQISSPDSVVEEETKEVKKPQKKAYEYSKFGDLDRSSSSESERSVKDGDETRSPSVEDQNQPKMSAMQRFLAEKMDSTSRDGMSPAAIAKRAVQELKNSPAQQMGGASPPVVSAAGFATSTFSDLFTDKPYEDSPRHIPPEIAALPPYFPALSGCRSVEEFECVNRIDEGTYGVVYRAKEKKTGEMVALKRLKMEKEREGFPITSLREISTLLKAQHPNIVTVREIVVGSNMDKIYIVMDFVEHDLKALMESMASPFLPGEVKTLMIQLLRGVAHMHDNWIIHRDLKTSNLLLSHRGVLKIGDFGLAREYGSPLKEYTQVVVTLWYRSPELLLGTKKYSTAVDLWSVGCIFAEIINKKPLLPGRSEMEELNLIFKTLGTPNEKIWPGLASLPGWKKAMYADNPYNSLRNKFEKGTLSDAGFQLLNALLTYDPEKRIAAEKALKSSYFTENPLPVPPSMFPTWPAKSEGGSKPKKREKTPPAPEAGIGAYKILLGEDDDEERFNLNVAQGPSLF